MLDRRRLLTLMLSTTLSTRAFAQVFAAPTDQGIGGTGAAPSTADSDRGIGGTGVIGTIRKFGSIIVNDLRIAYPDDVEVRIDGRPANVSDLRLGQVVRVVANGVRGSLSTRAIDVTSEVVGPVETIASRRLVVLGQTVAANPIQTKGIKAGDVVAVSGLRRNDGTIVASLVERRDGVSYRVAGPVDVAATGALRIGGLPLSGVNPSLVGRRAVLEGARVGDRFMVAHGTSEATLLPSDVRALSIESYVERRGGTVALGSGFVVDGIDALKIPPGQSVRSIVEATVESDGRLTVERVRAGTKTYAMPGADAGNRGSNGSGRDNGGAGEPGGRTSPMNFGPASSGRPLGGSGIGGPGGFGGGTSGAPPPPPGGAPPGGPGGGRR